MTKPDVAADALNAIAPELQEDDMRALARFVEFKKEFLGRLEREIVGQPRVLEDLLAAFFAGGHALLTGAPGLGKTRMARAIAQTLALKFSRVQFTPDLMPSDLLGSNILQATSSGERLFEFLPGPIFTNVLLADEINRTPPKTQAALLEAMQERQVTVVGKRYELENPFFVLATQNPIEQEGTYLLPEAQLDRFLFSLTIDYPKASDEIDMALMTSGAEARNETHVVTREEALEYQALVRRVIVARRVAEYAVEIVRKTRPQTKNSAEATQQYVEWGAGPRASQAMLLAAKAYAAMSGRPTASYDDVERAAPNVLRSRVRLNYLAQADGMTVDFLVKMILREAREELERRRD